MTKYTHGHVFEAAVIDSLRTHYSCGVRTSDLLDRRHKVDGLIHRVGGKRLRMEVHLQITLRSRHHAKLREYLATRWLNRDIVSLYVEVENGRSPEETAEHIAWAAQETQHLSPFGPLPIFGLTVDDDATFFDPYARLRELAKECHSPERAAALQPGTAYEFGRDGFKILGDDSRDYSAHYIDAFSQNFRRKLRTSTGSQVRVQFIPTGPSWASDVRALRTGS